MVNELPEIENQVIAEKNAEIALAHEVRDLARAECNRLIEENRALRARQEEHLALIAKLSQTVPLESEVAEALEQRGKLVAEIGTLKAANAELTEWRTSVSNAIKSWWAFEAGQWAGDKEGWGYHFEVVRALVRAYDEHRQEIAGLQGEIAGLRVSAGFFEQRSEDMEKAIKGTLGAAEKRRNQGHCVLCGMTAAEVGEMVADNVRRPYQALVRHIAEAPPNSDITDPPLYDWFVRLFVMNNVLVAAEEKLS